MSEPLQNICERQRLRKRVRYFFESRVRARDEVAAFADQLLGLGPVAAIGGFLRDLHLAGNRMFNSDVDFVIAPTSIQEFERFVAQRKAQVNRFGGYGIALGRWKVDVWPLERTWASVHGHVDVHELSDLLNVTFFDWDAVLYSIGERQIITRPGYFERVRDRVIDINLMANPNPLGNAVRALRYAYRWDAFLGEGWPAAGFVDTQLS